MRPDELPNVTPEQSLRIILDGVTSLRNGDFSCRLPEELPGDAGRIARAFDELLDMLAVFRSEHHRLMQGCGGPLRPSCYGRRGHSWARGHATAARRSSRLVGA